jgi:hypothetical protein
MFGVVHTDERDVDRILIEEQNELIDLMSKLEKDAIAGHKFVHTTALHRSTCRAAFLQGTLRSAQELAA